MVMLFTKVGIPFILHEVDRYNLGSAISRQLAIAFKNIEITDEIEKLRVSQPAILSAQYVSGMIHELASSANKGKAAVTYIRGSDEYREVNSRNWKIELSKIEAAFDDIGTFTMRALEIKDIARMKFIRTLEFRSINDIIRDVIHDYNNEARKKHAKINWKWDKAHEQKHAYFDEILIKQAIRNLVSNSIKWIPDGGGGKIDITSGEKEDFIFVRVEDNGWGIAPEIEKSIFEPFFTTSNTGYGIGLFFVKNVVKIHEGEVKIVSMNNPTILEIKISSKLKKEVE
jgi:signal transduction histidine kinase